MNVFDLIVAGIEVQMSREDSFVEDAITFRFRKNDQYYQRIVKRAEILDFNGGAVSSSLLEDLICHEVMEHFKGFDKDEKPTLKIGDWAICDDTKVVGRIINFYTPTACEEQIMVKTRNGRRYHAPFKMWKPYQFGVEATTIIVDEPLLNAHGQYAVKFAKNHGISIDKALEHPTVKAHQEYRNAVEINQDILLKNPGLLKEQEFLIQKEVENNCATEIQRKHNQEFLRRG